MDRAREQLGSLQTTAQGFLDNDANKVMVYRSVEAGYEVIGIPRIPRLPQAWGSRVTEVANNARAALDFLVLQLSIAGGGDPKKHKTAFPIAIERDQYLKPIRRGGTYRDKCMPGVAEQWKLKVDQLQPFQRGMPGAWSHPLAQLNRLSNRGKHQTTNVPYAMIDTPRRCISFESRDEVRELRIRYRGDDEVEVLAGLVAPGVGGEMGIRIYHSPRMGGEPGRLGVGFGDDRLGLLNILDIIDAVDAALVEFDPAFPPRSEPRG